MTFEAFHYARKPFGRLARRRFSEVSGSSIAHLDCPMMLTAESGHTAVRVGHSLPFSIQPQTNRRDPMAAYTPQ